MSQRDPDWPWLRVALGVARGLQYLHHSCHPPAVHGAVHPRNVLLDERGEPRVAEVGGVRLALGDVGAPVAKESLAYRAPGEALRFCVPVLRGGYVLVTAVTSMWCDFPWNGRAEGCLGQHSCFEVHAST